VGAMTRELLVAEALAALGVPTTRGLAVVAGRDVDDAAARPCAVLLRAAETFLRFGSFEVTLPHRSGHPAPSAFDWQLLRNLADHCISAYYGHLAEVPEEEGEEDEDLRVAPRYHELVLDVTRRTARLAAAWHCLGALHGMLNTDNLCISGASLDHGSFAFVEHFNPDFAGYAKEPGGRYCLSRQPEAACWACERLAEALLPLHCTPIADMLQEVTALFDQEFGAAYDEGMRQKLGLKGHAPELVTALLALMHRTDADWSCTFRALTTARSEEEALAELGHWHRGGAEAEWTEWLRRYTVALVTEHSSWDSTGRMEAMAAANPVVVPREWLLDRAARSAEAGEYAEVRRILGVLTRPYEAPANPADAWPLALGKLDTSMLSQLTPLAAQALQDASFWHRICPDLHISSSDSAAPCLGSFAVSEARAAALRAAMGRDGVFTVSPKDLPWSVNLAVLAQSVEQLHAAGWPPALLWVYDEPWAMLAQVEPLLQQVLGAQVCFDLAVHRLPPGQVGLRPRRERPLAGLRAAGTPGQGGACTGLRADGTPAFAACLVPLSDAPSTGSCLMCMPRAQDSGYAETGSLHWGVEMLHHIRSLSLGAGGACVLSHRLLHWARAGDPVAPDGRPASPCTFLSLAVADDAFELPRLPRRLLPLPPLHLRVALAAGQALERGAVDGCGEGTGRLLWDCFLACSRHFDPAFCSSVFRASPLGREP